MTRTTFDYEAMAVDSAPVGYTAVLGSGVVSAANPAHGTKGLRLTFPNAAAQSVRLAISATKVEQTVYFESSFTDYPNTTFPTILYVRAGGSATPATRVQIQGSSGTKRTLRVQGQAGEALWSSTTQLAPGTRYRIGLYVEAGTSTTTGAVRCAIYVGDSTTPLEDSGRIAGVNTAGTNGSFDGAVLGAAAADNVNAAIWDLDDHEIKTDADATNTFAPFAVVPTSPVFPNAVVSNTGGWSNQGGASSIAAALADGSDATYIQSPGSSTGEEIIVSCASLSAGAIRCSGRYRLAPGESTGSMTIELRQGSTVIKTLTPGVTPGVPALTTNWQDWTYTLTTSEASAVTDRSSLRYRFVAN